MNGAEIRRTASRRCSASGAANLRQIDRYAPQRRELCQRWVRELEGPNPFGNGVGQIPKIDAIEHAAENFHVISNKDHLNMSQPPLLPTAPASDLQTDAPRPASLGSTTPSS